jgi:hypothetical protein
MTQQQPSTDPGKDFVTIFMDGDDAEHSHSIHRGHQTVTAIKTACNVPQTDVIELIAENGKLEPLDDNGSLTIKGGEHFISHKRGGGSS